MSILYVWVLLHATTVNRRQWRQGKTDRFSTGGRFSPRSYRDDPNLPIQTVVSTVCNIYDIRKLLKTITNLWGLTGNRLSLNDGCKFFFFWGTRVPWLREIVDVAETLIPKTTDYCPLCTNDARVSHVIVRITRLILVVIRPQYTSNIMLWYRVLMLIGYML